MPLWIVFVSLRLDVSPVAYSNQPVAGSHLRPDLILVSGEEALIVDIAFSFDNMPEAFTQVGRQKILKYDPMCRLLLRR